jgi:hypothetical protein
METPKDISFLPSFFAAELDHPLGGHGGMGAPPVRSATSHLTLVVPSRRPAVKTRITPGTGVVPLDQFFDALFLLATRAEGDATQEAA